MHPPNVQLPFWDSLKIFPRHNAKPGLIGERNSDSVDPALLSSFKRLADFI
jgi:hypothetical protein